MRSLSIRVGLSALFALTLALFSAAPVPAQEEEEKTYSIDLVKTAEVDKEIHEVEDKKVLTQTVTIEKGQWIWKILREKGLLNRGNMAQVISVLKKLNKSFDNLDLVHPGQKIIVPLKIVPITGAPVVAGAPPEKVITISDLKDLDFEQYTVMKGDTVTRVAAGRYDIPPEDTYREYLELVKKLNPSIKDLDRIYPGQVIRLPIYSPEIIRKPIEPIRPEKEVKKIEPKATKEKPSPLGRDLAAIFVEMGEEWIQTGKHFIPLKSGGQIDLQAKTYPIINIRNGLRIILDMNNSIPENMARLIGSSWGNYRIVHLSGDDDLRSAMDRVLKTCDYPKIFGPDESLELQGDISLKINGDWIVKLSKGDADGSPGFAVITLTEGEASNSPRMIKDFLLRLGVRLVDYPPADDVSEVYGQDVELLGGGDDPPALIGTLLNLTGRSFSTGVEIPVYQSKKADFKLLIKADFFLKVNGRDAIIALTDLGQEVISLLEDHGFLVLSLAGEKDPLKLVARTLDFVGVKSDQGPHAFMIANRDASKNIRMTLPGSVFSDASGRSILATPLNLPVEITGFLSRKGYRILVISFS